MTRSASASPFGLSWLVNIRSILNATHTPLVGTLLRGVRPCPSASVRLRPLLFSRTARRCVTTIVPTIVPTAVLYRNLYLIFLFLKGEQYKVDVLVTDDQFPRNFKPHIHNMMQLRLQLFLRSHRHDQRLRDNHEGSKPSLRATC